MAGKGMQEADRGDMPPCGWERQLTSSSMPQQRPPAGSGLALWSAAGHTIGVASAQKGALRECTHCTPRERKAEGTCRCPSGAAGTRTEGAASQAPVHLGGEAVGQAPAVLLNGQLNAAGGATCRSSSREGTRRVTAMACTVPWCYLPTGCASWHESGFRAACDEHQCDFAAARSRGRAAGGAAAGRGGDRCRLKLRGGAARIGPAGEASLVAGAPRDVRRALSA